MSAATADGGLFDIFTGEPPPYLGASPLLAAALAAHDAGACVVPPLQNGSKAPIGLWKRYQSRRPARTQVETWYKNPKRTGIGYVGGAVSGGLEMLEFEGRAVDAGLVKRFCDDAKADPILAAIIDKVAAGWSEKSPSGGLHLQYLCIETGNVKLAKRADGKDLIETKGEGGYFIGAPSNGTVHPTGEAWQSFRGGPATVVDLAPDERQLLHEHARRYHETPSRKAHREPEGEWQESPPRTFTGASWIDAVVADYNARNTWGDVLAGKFEHLHDKGTISYWHYIGADNDIGATTNAKGTDTLIVFSGTANGAGWDIFDGNGKAPSYDKFSAHVQIEHGRSDTTTRTEAARKLRSEGYGPPPEPDSSDGDTLKAGRRTTPSPPSDDPGTEEEGERSSFDRIDLEPVVAGNYTQPTPDLLERSDGQALFYRGQVNGLHGDSGTGKGWVLCFAIAQLIRQGEKVMLVDLEDVPGSIVARLRLLGLSDAQIVAGLDYRRPTTEFTRAAVAQLVADVTTGGHALVIIDSLGEAFALNGINEDKDAEVGPWLRAVARPLGDTGAAVVLVDHSTKAADNPLHPSGSKRKRAAIGGASYLLDAVRPLAKGRGGRLRLTCAKDRHGTYARKEVAAHLVVAEHDGTGPLDVRLYAPDPTPGGDGPEVEVLVLAQRMIRTVKDSETPMSKKTLEVTTSGRTDRKRAALDHAINAGCLDFTKGKHGAHLLRWVRNLEVS